MIASESNVSWLCDHNSTQRQTACSRVLVLYTGGTIGMQTVNGVYCPAPGYLPGALAATPHMNDASFVFDIDSQTREPNEQRKWLALPPVKNCLRRIIYTIIEYNPLLDSSDMTANEWIAIGKDIQQMYTQFDGFVVLHGTDTMSYTASALSFMFSHLSKPVVVTGSQIPVGETRSDGHENLIGALITAGTLDIAEVCLYFNSKLFRGNRTSKVDNCGLDAFNSPNMAPLARFNVNIDVDWDSVYRPMRQLPLALHTNLDCHVGVLRIFPSISAETVRAFVAEPMRGVVLQTYGSGNVPSRRRDILDELRL